MKANTDRNILIEDKGNLIKIDDFRGRKSKGVFIKPKNFKYTSLRLLKFFEKEKKLLSIILFLLIISSGIGLITPYLIGLSIDDMSFKSGIVNFEKLKVVTLILIIVYVIDVVINFIQSWIIAGISQRVVKKLRNSIFEKLHLLPINFFDLHTHGEIMSRLSNDIENVSSTISQSTVQLIAGIITIVGTLVMMIKLSPILTLASITTIPLVIILTKTIAKRTKILFKNQQIELGKLNGYVEESISGIFVVKAFNKENKITEQFTKINTSLCEVSVNAQIWSGFIMPLMNVINNIGFVIVASIGGILAVKNVITIGIIASFLSYSKQFVRPLNDLANVFNTLQSAVAGAERVFEILDEIEEKEDIINAKEIKNINGNVIFDKVYFGYKDDINILKDINFSIKAGNNVALVGSTGAGKTTIINLLARFYDVSSGRILIDDIDIREYKRADLRRCFGIVLQDTYLFSGTIRDNIRYGRLDATNKEIEDAAIMANADKFIRKMPNGYKSVILENGSNLSQGQKQLISIARAILANPSILILDEATSSVDTYTELYIQQAMRKLMKGRTSFIIAHRLSTIKDANTIMVIDKGEIVEIGNHTSLIDKKGIYYDMYSKQF